MTNPDSLTADSEIAMKSNAAMDREIEQHATAQLLAVFGRREASVVKRGEGRVIRAVVSDGAMLRDFA